jgi:hypothetical protein
VEVFKSDYGRGTLAQVGQNELDCLMTTLEDYLLAFEGAFCIRPHSCD